MELANLQGLIPIVCGIYFYLIANGTLPKNPKEPEKLELWRKKFGKMMKTLCPIIVVFGILQLTGVV
ncbi:hypothetical protein [Candidatus Uabimicrobium amorphum]|uniref:Uncharacterized protein n=1 Tax=Uabimicrobium amorphum TaxID=2596890 RepID=A0A5S9IMB0_UABAM|nr:hypothetical protein [Candidatus Uabimicrobium amorphum]BBM84160.1 hypothetical protein UABAM_02516 [Candidatus Uabimicrobium amorphum]